VEISIVFEGVKIGSPSASHHLKEVSQNNSRRLQISLSNRGLALCALANSMLALFVLFVSAMRDESIRLVGSFAIWPVFCNQPRSTDKASKARAFQVRVRVDVHASDFSQHGNDYTMELPLLFTRLFLERELSKTP
jgi:hypothetical protein